MKGIKNKHPNKKDSFSSVKKKFKNISAKVLKKNISKQLTPILI
jgi:hypothetical protein